MVFMGPMPAVNPAVVLGGFLLAALGTWVSQAPAKVRRIMVVALLAVIVSGVFAAQASAFDVVCVKCVFDWFPLLCYFVDPC